MHECNGATTLYGETLHVHVTAGKKRPVKEEWKEDICDPVTDRARNEIQQGYLRRARGEDTAGDLRADALKEHERRIESGEAEKGRYDPDV